jgi:hypothetical protein
MKIAICGSGPLAIEMALLLNHSGAEAYLFAKPNLEFGLGGQLRKLFQMCPEMNMELLFKELSSELGRSLTKCPLNLNETLNIKQYVEQYLEPLIKICYEKKLVKIGEVSRVHKRFLSKKETPKKNSRLIDLFRLVYKTIPNEEVDSTIIENREALKDIDENLFESLKSGFERFEDFDFIVDATGNLGNPNPMGPSESFALNELQLSVKHEGSLDKVCIKYGYESIVLKKEILKDSKHVALIGTGLTAARTLLEYINFLEDNSHKLTIITDEERPFEQLFTERENPLLLKALNRFFDVQENNYKKQIVEFEKNILEWKSLDDHIKTKSAKPEEPTPCFDIINGANVTSIDKLLDRKGLFLTVETPDFREEKSPLEMKTFQVDHVFVCTGFKSHGSLDNDCFRTEEPGFYQLGINEDGKTSLLPEGIKKTKSILNNMLTFFSKVEEDSLDN